jgi:hypothetical protein
MTKEIFYLFFAIGASTFLQLVISSDAIKLFSDER